MDTIAAAVGRANVGGGTTSAVGVDIDSKDTSKIAAGGGGECGREAYRGAEEHVVYMAEEQRSIICTLYSLYTTLYTALYTILYTAAIALVKDADAIVLSLGITRDQVGGLQVYSIGNVVDLYIVCRLALTCCRCFVHLGHIYKEHEGIDRQDTKLPGQQESFAHQVLAAAGGKPLILVLCNGGILSIDSLTTPPPVPTPAPSPRPLLPDAIIEAFNPAVMGPRALAESIFGMHNRWGKLPVTVRPTGTTCTVCCS
jgi:hypothetical protein